ncbi:glycosyl hydrolase family 61-domain-containing protein [Mycena epipterygia]|nr:glycosyl hydrolase family 61-domain-containing protein [Mycena epipterygia]
MTDTFFVLILLASYVSAHGFVSRVSVNGQTFQGNIPNEDPTVKSIIRQISDPSPVKGATNPAVNCGTNAQLAAKAANVQPGDTMAFFWVSADPTILFWPHNTGPMLAYLAKCDDSDCTTFNSSAAKWFKIQEEGRIPGNADGNWTQNIIFGAKNVAANVTLPSTLAPGPYLIRHEIIALQNAQDVFPDPSNPIAGAEFYPSCSQIIVGGNETGAPSKNELVSLPGAYSNTEPGIHIDPFDNKEVPYPFPGPPIAAFVASSSGTPQAKSSSPSSTAASTKAPTSSATKPTSTGSCRKKRSNSTQRRSRTSRMNTNVEVLPQGPIDADVARGYMK